MPRIFGSHLVMRATGVRAHRRYVLPIALVVGVIGASTATAFANTAQAEAPTLKAASNHCQTVQVKLRDNNPIGTASTTYTVTVTSGSTEQHQTIREPGGSVATRKFTKLSVGTYTVSASGDDGTSASPVTQAVASCKVAPVVKGRASFGRPNFKKGYVPTKLDNRGSNVKVEFLVFDSRNHFQSQDFVKAGKARTFKTPIKKHGKSRVVVKLDHKTIAKKKFHHN